ncbi:metal ABC transporter solute-binding protein, Zn/Mn family [Prosthecochloris sp. SCSIO W1103]|uniref:metal ABC transporter solute-binding protein, Zn/Mn family n=2 Tax=unclassified Prosthecochloris TaxID=2632826 RepID=UPI00223D4551|nr:zinc ABC transporter substrate-binding protein [Prosthecochloris sp. SCSIO W1103]UZJ37791.1 zinc ABC transporter substrate-binding protein [Prosthecochloris sp. SCSIO W1103]
MRTGTKQIINGVKVVAMACVMLFAVNLQVLYAGAKKDSTSKTEAKKMRVVTSIVPLSFFVKQIGGEHVDVTVMVPPGANPHTYDPTPGQMTALGDAGMFVKAGSGIEFELDWMKKFTALNPHMVVCDASRDYRSRTMQGHGGDHVHEKIDPHFWLSPQNGILIANNIERCLATLDPQHKIEYAENRRMLEVKLGELSVEITQKLEGMKNRAFMVFHPAWGYFADEFNLKQIAAEKEGKELTPKTMQQVIDQAKKYDIKVVFVSPTFSSLQAETIAREIGGVIQPVDPLSGDYIDNLRQAAEAFVASMQ